MKQRRPARFRAPCPGRDRNAPTPTRRREDGPRPIRPAVAQPTERAFLGRKTRLRSSPARESRRKGREPTRGYSGTRPRRHPSSRSQRRFSVKTRQKTRAECRRRTRKAGGQHRGQASRQDEKRSALRAERGRSNAKGRRGQRQEGREPPITSGPCNMAQVRQLRAGLARQARPEATSANAGAAARPPPKERPLPREHRPRTPPLSAPQGAQYTIPMAARNSSSVAFAISLARRLPSRSTSSM